MSNEGNESIHYRVNRREGKGREGKFVRETRDRRGNVINQQDNNWKKREKGNLPSSRRNRRGVTMRLEREEWMTESE